MNKFLIGILLLLILPSSAHAVNISTTTCPGAGCVDYNVSNQASFGVQITGTWVGTVTFQSSIDSSTFTSLLVYPSSSTTPVTTTTSNGVWATSVAGFKTIRIVFTAYTSGTASIIPQLTNLSKRLPNGSGGGGSGTVTSIDTALPITGGPITDSGDIECPTCGVTGSPLSQFAATTSAQLASTISDETGTTLLVFNTSPTIVTPTIAKLANLTSNGYVKTSGGDGTLSVETSLAAPGSNTQVLFNDSNVIAGDAEFVWNKTGDRLSVNGEIQVVTSNNALYQLGTTNTNYSSDIADGYQVFQFANGDAEIDLNFGTVGTDAISWYYDISAAQVLFYSELGDAQLFVTKNNTVNGALKLSHPDSTNVAWDTAPLAALFIEGPGSATTRNFLSGIWVETAGNAQDKGRGIAVNNTGHSDSFYAQHTVADGCAYCAQLNAAAYGLAISTNNSSAVGAYLRGEEGLDSPVISLVADDGDDATDTWNISSLASDNSIRITNNSNTLFSILPTGNLVIGGTTPAVTDTSANSCGTGTQTIVGNDNAGKVTVIGSAGTSCTVTFATAFANAPSCTVTNETTAALVRATSTTTTTILAGVFAQNDILAYICLGR